ncbi:MAG: hypothetical protein HN564_02245 [Flavobacteriales bacterium]|nr:hypothetical protein [Flavobacteriales bacterium]
MNILKEIITTIFILLFTTNNIYAQNISSDYKLRDMEKHKSPKKAAILSIIPGAGQFYTQKYWKIPIIYSALITSAYYINDNNDQYKMYKNTYLNRMNGQDDDIDYTNNELIILKDHYKRNREISVMLFSLTYLLNIIDASVNAHLFEYEVNENLLIQIRPVKMIDSYHTGIALNIRL